jgi:hypothetical protein
LTREKQVIEQLKKQVADSSHFLNYTENQRKKLLKGDWRIGISWVDLGVEAGFHERYFRDIYGYLCGYSHSSYASALQVGQAQSIEDQQALTQAILGIGLVLMAHFAFSYASFFNVVDTVLSANVSAKEIAEKWRFGPEDMADIYDG